MFKLPVIIVNFKTYKEATGKNALKLAKQIEKAQKEVGGSVVLAVEVQDIRMIADTVSLPVFAQHVDVCGFGAHTGGIIPEAVKDAGAVGTIVNHAEHEISDEQIKATIKHCKKIGLFSVLCANTVNDVKRLKKFKPDVIAVEPPKLIGTGISVSSAKPEVIKGSVKASGRIPLLCGAGIQTGEDVFVSLKLGAKGVLLASGVVKDKNPYKKMKELLLGLSAH